MSSVPRTIDSRPPEPASAEGRAALAAELLRSGSMRELAGVLVGYAQRAFGCREAVLVWSPDGGSAREQYPQRALAADEDRLVHDALAQPLQAPVRCSQGRRIAMAMRAGDAEAWAVLVCDTERPGDAWDCFMTLARPRLAQALEVERLRHSVRRLEKAERLQRALFGIADLASSVLDMNDVLRAMHDIVATLMYAENLYIVQFDPVQDAVRFIYFVDTVDPDRPRGDQAYPMREIEYSPTWHLIRRGKPLMGTTEDLLQQLDCGSPLHGSGPRALDWLGVPLLSGREVRGAIVVQSYVGICYTPEDNALLQFVARHIQTAIERKQAQEELERRVEERTRELAETNRILTLEVHERQRGAKLQAALFRIAELASTAHGMDEFYSAVHAIVGELLYARNFFIALVTEDGESLWFPYAEDENDPRSHFKARRIENGLTDYLLKNGRPLLVTRDDIDAMIASGVVRSAGTRSACWLGVPLIDGERTVGALVVQSYGGEYTYTRRDQELLTFVSFHIATGLQRKRAQESLKTAYADLERRVEERTRELAEANRELRDQISVRERIELKLKHEALHDSLTGLPNRSFLLDRLSRALARFRRDPSHQFAVLFLDLDRFKVVNDSVGHLVGDEMLKEAGERLHHCVREPDVVSRLGGDEFAILLEDIHAIDAVAIVAQRVIDSLSDPMRVGGKELFTSASVGIALSHERYASAEELLRDADVAMYRAKAKGRKRFELFDERLHAEALHLLDLEGDLRRAIPRQEFEPHFQAIVRLSDASVVGYEALLRWRHPERGLLLPADFLAVAEESGSAEQIDWQMFELTCRQLPLLATNGRYVSMNVSARHFRQPDLARRVIDLLAQFEVPPFAVRLEVTEGVLLDNPEQIRDTLEALRVAGVLTALDDFGTGYSSLSYLHRFPLQALKIDRSFVADLRPGSGGGGSAPVVRAICTLAGSLGMEVIAEGIETSYQREALVELGCTLGQGFLFAHPRPAEEAARMAAD
ncbi:MAG TPA: bifunctional diguanylate cyclase/phosphodiesterase [Xanthomonadales bacterium]|nr:bifunctional diguanylate cyclase/phosphodiesterase [Xanthomonadales bacterium]